MPSLWGLILTTTLQDQDNGDTSSTGPVVPEGSGAVAGEVLPERSDEPTGDGNGSRELHEVADGSGPSVSDDDHSDQHNTLPDGEQPDLYDQPRRRGGGVRKAEQLRGSDKPRLGQYKRKVPHQQHPGEHREDSGDSPVQSTSHGTEEGVRRDKQDGPVPTIQHPVVPRINVEKTNRRKHEVIPLEIPANKVSKWWPLIRGGIEEVLGRNSPGLIPEDVYSFLAQKRAWLVIAVNKETKKYEGFVILAEELPNVFLDVPDMLIWIAYSKVPGTALKLFPHIEKAAKKNGYKRIAFHSARDGWQKRAKAYGFSLTERVYHKRL
jgi:hypothetical protein